MGSGGKGLGFMGCSFFSGLCGWHIAYHYCFIVICRDYSYRDYFIGSRGF